MSRENSFKPTFGGWQEGRFMVFQIMVDGEGIDVFYIADSREDAIKKHLKKCTELYFESFNKKPDDGIFDGIDAKRRYAL